MMFKKVLLLATLIVAAALVHTDSMHARGQAARGAFGGALGGATLGGIFGGGRGAAIGAGVGAGVGLISGAAAESRERRYYDDGDYDYYEEPYYSDEPQEYEDYDNEQEYID